MRTADLEVPITPQIQQWASRQLADYDARNPGTLFAEGVVLDIAEGYAVQSAVAELRRRRGEPHHWLQSRLHIADDPCTTRHRALCDWKVVRYRTACFRCSSLASALCEPCD